MCSEKHCRAFSAFILRFDCLHFTPQNQYTFNHESLHVVALSSHTQKPTVSPTFYYLLLTNQRPALQLLTATTNPTCLHLQPLYTPTAVATTCHVPSEVHCVRYGQKSSVKIWLLWTECDISKDVRFARLLCSRDIYWKMLSSEYRPVLAYYYAPEKAMVRAGRCVWIS